MTVRCTSIVMGKSQRKSLAHPSSDIWPKFARRAAGVRSAATRPTATRTRTGVRTGEWSIWLCTATSQAAQGTQDCFGPDTSPVSSTKWMSLPSRCPQILHVKCFMFRVGASAAVGASLGCWLDVKSSIRCLFSECRVLGMAQRADKGHCKSCADLLQEGYLL